MPQSVEEAARLARESREGNATGIPALSAALDDLPLASAPPELIADLLDALQSRPDAQLGQLEDHASLVPCFAPLLGYADVSVRSAARSLLERIVAHASSPRELFLAMCGVLASVGESDEEDEADEVDERSAADELIGLLGLIALLLPRIRTKKPAGFVSDVALALDRALDGLDLSPRAAVADPPSARILLAVLELVERVGNSGWTAGDSGALAVLLLIGVARVAADDSVRQSLAADAYRATHASHRDARLQALAPIVRSFDPTQIWNEVLRCAATVDLGPQRCLELAIASDGSEVDIASASAGAFVLLAQLRSHGAVAADDALDRLHVLLPRYLSTLSPHATIDLAAIDAALYLLQSDLVALDDEASLDEAIVLPLVEVLSTLSATSSDPSIRFIAFQLLSELIVYRSAGDETLQMAIMRDLLVDCPFEPMRRAAYVVLRQLIVQAFARPESLFASPRLLEEFGPQICALPADVYAQLAEGSSLETVQHEHTTLCAERVDLCYFLLRRDRANQTGMRDAVHRSAIRAKLVGPLRRAVATWSVDAAAAPDELSTLNLLSFSLDHLEEALRDLAS